MVGAYLIKKQLTLAKESCKYKKWTKNEERKPNKCGVQTKICIYGKNVQSSVYHIYVLSYKIMPSLEYQIIVYISL